MVQSINAFETERDSSDHGPGGRIGSLVARTYRIVRHIGSGGSSHVFEGEHVRLRRRFAIKLMRAELDINRSTAQRFRREARAIARLDSDHVVSVVDCGELDDQTPYLVMELLHGEDLRSLLNREQVLPLRRALSLVTQACRGVAAVHASGLTHRDLKPENLFVASRATGEDCCKVLDFGVAKMESSLTTTPGMIVGTVRYMAPEQLITGAEVGPSADVYALGAILYESLGGKPAHTGETVQQLMYAVMNEPPQALEELAPGLPKSLFGVVARTLHKDPAQRPATVDELASLLADVLPQPLDGSASTAQIATESAVPQPERSPRPVVRTHFGPVVLLACSAAAASVGWIAGVRHEIATAARVPDSSSKRAPSSTAARPGPPPVAQARPPDVLVPPTSAAPAPAVPAVPPRTRVSVAVVPSASPPAASASRRENGLQLDVANPYNE